MRRILKWTGISLLALLAIAFGVGCYFMGSPRDLYGFLRYALPQWHQGDLKVGDRAPDAHLISLDGASSFYIHDRIGARPLILIFGSYTWPPFRRQIGDLVKMYNDYKDHADFLAVYIREAHPLDEWEMKKNLDENVCYPQPKTLAQRIAIANDFTQRFHFPLPLGIDAMNDFADHLYGGWPERLYVIDESGKIVYRGGLGPFNYHPDEVRAWLKQRFPSAQTSAAD